LYDFIVTGSEGFLGIPLVNFLEKMGFSVLRLDIQNGCDLSKPEVVESIFRENRARNLVNLFALNDKVEESGFSSTFLDLDLSEFRRTLDINVISLFSVCREFIRNNTGGHIVNFSSIYALRSPDPRIYETGEKPIGYGVSKAAVSQLSRHLATHTAPNFRINTIVLGGVREDQDENFVQRYSQKVPLGRMGNPNDIHEAVLFLTSESSSYITGSEVIIDGGLNSW